MRGWLLMENEATMASKAVIIEKAPRYVVMFEGVTLISIDDVLYQMFL